MSTCTRDPEDYVWLHRHRIVAGDLYMWRHADSKFNRFAYICHRMAEDILQNTTFFYNSSPTYLDVFSSRRVEL